MNSTVIVLNPPGLRIPTELPDLSAFRAWVNAAELPPGVRIDYLAGEVAIDMSPQDVTTHGTPKPPVIEHSVRWSSRYRGTRNVCSARDAERLA